MRRETTPTVLLVDDEACDRELMRRTLEEEGYAVIEATDSHNALNLFDEHQDEIAMLVADVALPDGNGCDIARTMLTIIPDLKVLFVSGHVGAEICKFYGLAVPDIHFLRKPFNSAKFATRIRRVLETTEPLIGHLLAA